MTDNFNSGISLSSGIVLERKNKKTKLGERGSSNPQASPRKRAKQTIRIQEEQATAATSSEEEEKQRPERITKRKGAKEDYGQLSPVTMIGDLADEEEEKNTTDQTTLLLLTKINQLEQQLGTMQKSRMTTVLTKHSFELTSVSYQGLQQLKMHLQKNARENITQSRAQCIGEDVRDLISNRLRVADRGDDAMVVVNDGREVYAWELWNDEKFFEVMLSIVAVETQGNIIAIGDVVERMKNISFSVDFHKPTGCEGYTKEVFKAWREYLNSLPEDDVPVGIESEVVKKLLHRIKESVEVHSGKLGKLLKTMYERLKGNLKDNYSIEHFTTHLTKACDEHIQFVATAVRLTFLPLSEANTLRVDGKEERTNSKKTVPKSESTLKKSFNSQLRDGTKSAGCKGCGMRNHTPNECCLQTHPDYNRDPNKDFLESEIGKQYKKQGLDHINCRKTITGLTGNWYVKPNKQTQTTYKKKKGESCVTCESISTVCECVNTCCEHQDSSQYVHMDVRQHDVYIHNILTLIDTGASYSSYVSQTLRHQLVTAGAETRQTQRTVCTGIWKQGCTTVTEEVDLVVVCNGVECELKNCGVLENPVVDLIIGQPDIQQHPTIQTALANQIKNSHLYMTDEVLAMISEPPPLSTQTQDILQLPTEVHGSPSLQKRVHKLLNEYKDIFSTHLRKQHALVEPMEIEIDKDLWEVRPNQQPPRPQGASRHQEIVDQVQVMLDYGVIRISNAKHHSQVLLTPKPGSTPQKTNWRFCIDYRRLNLACKSINWPIPNIKHILERLGNQRARLFATLDCTKGYYQCPLAESCKGLTAFTTTLGVFEWNRVAMGLKGAPAYFVRVMQSTVLARLIYNICEMYFDDIIVYGNDENTYLGNLEKVFKRLRQYKITLNPTKCRFGLEEIEYVGHVINKQGWYFSKEKIAKVINFKKPVTEKQLKSFLGLANHFRTHVKGHSVITRVLHDLTKNYKKNRLVHWNEETDQAFEDIKTAIANSPSLFFLNDDLPIHLCTDACLYGIGAYLYQVDKEGKELPVAFYSRSLNKTNEYRWTLPEKECFAIVAALKEFDYLLRDRRFTIHTDHRNLTFLKDEGSNKIIQWKLLMQQYDMTIAFVSGEHNTVADYLSRCPEEESLMETCAATNELQGSQIPLEIKRLLETVHSDANGHHGVERTLAHLAKAGVTVDNTPKLRKMVGCFLRECPTCQKLSVLKLPIKIAPFTIGTTALMTKLCVDTIGPLPADDSGHDHVLVIQDAFSRFVELYPIRGNTAESACKALCQHVGRYGIPEEVLSDNGKEYCNALTSQMFRIMGTGQDITIPYSKEENGLVERANKEVNRHLRAYLLHAKYTHWANFLPFVQRIYNASTNRSIGVAPADLLFGPRIELSRRLIPGWRTVTQYDESSANNWLSRLILEQNRLIEAAERNQINHDEVHSENRPEELTEYSPGDFVLLSPPNSALVAKWGPKHKGPYKVVSKQGNLYTIQHSYLNTVQKAGVHRLRRFHYDKTRTDPVSIARWDQNERFMVVSVLGHTGKPKRANAMKFTVKMEGGNTEYLTLDQLKEYPIFHEYLRGKGMESLIPAKFRSTSTVEGIPQTVTYNEASREDEG